jgi:hypothetical protein
MFAALILSVATAQGTLTPPPDGLDASPYQPNDDVKSFGTEGAFKANTDYITNDVGMSTSTLLIIIFGALFWLFLICWNCCTCCCWRHGKKEGSRMKKYVAIGLMCGSLLAVFISFVAVIASVGELQDFLMNIPDTVEYITYWKNDTTNILDQVNVRVDYCAVNIGCDRQDATGAYVTSCEGNSTGVPGTPQNAFSGYTSAVDGAIATAGGAAASTVSGWDEAVTAVSTAYSTMSSSLTEITTDLNAMDLNFDFRSTMQELSDGLGSLIGGIWVMFILVLVQGVFGIMNMVAPPKCQPRKACSCIQPCFTLAFLLIFIFIWILACLFFVLVTVNADFCIDFDTSVLDLVDSDPTTAFYVKCDTDTTLANPLQVTLDTLNASIAAAGTARDSIVRLATDNICGAGNPAGTQCAAWEIGAAPDNTVSQRFLNDCFSVDTLISASTGANVATGRYDTGTLLGQLDCTALNSRFQAMANLFCNDMVGILASFFRAFLCIGIFMFIIEVVRKEMRGESEDHKEKRESMAMDDFGEGEKDGQHGI